MHRALLPHSTLPPRKGLVGAFWHVLLIGVKPLDDSRQRLKVMSLNLVTLVTLLLPVGFLMLFVVIGTWPIVRSSLVQVALMPLLLVTLWLNHRQQHTAARLLFMVSANSYVCAFVLMGQGVAIYTHYYLLLSVVLSFMLVPLNQWPVMAVWMGVSLGQFLYLQITQWPAHPDFWTLDERWLVLCRVMVVGSCLALALLAVQLNQLAIDLYIELLNSTAMRDQLTGLPNRRAGMARLEQEMSVHTREQRPLSVALIDIDYFKLINDSLGHAMGDQVLCHVGNLLRRQLRAADCVARLGGEEFLLVLPQTDARTAWQVVDKLREDLSNSPYAWLSSGYGTERERGLTVSSGVASLCQGWDVARLLQAADEALYRAKQSGRNRVVASRGDAGSPSTQFDVNASRT